MPCNICPLVTHNQVDFIIVHQKGYTHLQPGWAQASGGSVSFIYHDWALSTNPRFVNGLLLMRAHLVQADTKGCSSVACPQPTWITKGWVESLGPPYAQGVRHFNHVCVMNAAAVNICLFTMSPKYSCNVVLMWVLLCHRPCICK